MSSRFTYSNGADHDLDLLHDSVAPGPVERSGKRHNSHGQQGRANYESQSVEVSAARSPATARDSTPLADCGEMRADRAVQTRKLEEMAIRQPSGLNRRTPRSRSIGCAATTWTTCEVGPSRPHPTP